MNSSTKEKIEYLKVQYCKKMPTKIAELEASWEMLQKSWCHENITNLLRIAHNLKGTSATYGCTAISFIASKIEIQAKAFDEKSFCSEKLKVIAKLLQQLKEQTFLNDN